MITKEKLELEKSTAYIRGYFAAIEILAQNVVNSKNEMEVEMLADKFKSFCDGHKSCNDCLYSDLGIEDCQEYFVQSFKEKENE